MYPQTHKYSIVLKHKLSKVLKMSKRKGVACQLTDLPVSKKTSS